jgi:ketosteroid isomerase-like protein
MKISSVAIAVLSLGVTVPAFGQQLSLSDRQAMSDRFAAEVAKKDVAALADHYTADLIFERLCPESEPIIGREARAKNLQAALDAGFRDYVPKIKEVHMLSDGRAWSVGTATFTLNDKDGKPQLLQVKWVDMLRREGNEWRTTFEAITRIPCSP